MIEFISEQAVKKYFYSTPSLSLSLHSHFLAFSSRPHPFYGHIFLHTRHAKAAPPSSSSLTLWSWTSSSLLTSLSPDLAKFSTGLECFMSSAAEVPFHTQKNNLEMEKKDLFYQDRKNQFFVNRNFQKGC